MGKIGYGYGSEWQLMRFLGHHRNRLDEEIKKQIGEKGDLHWLDFNFSDSDETAWINEVEDYVDLMTGKAREAKAVGIPACGFAWLLTTYKKNEQRKGRELPRLK